MRSVSAQLIPMRHKLRLRLLWKCQNHLIWFFSVRSSSSTLSSSQMTELFTLCLRLTQTHYRGSSFVCLYTWSFSLDHYPQLVAICEWMNTGDCSPSALFFTTAEAECNNLSITRSTITPLFLPHRIFRLRLIPLNESPPNCGGDFCVSEWSQEGVAGVS